MKNSHKVTIFIASLLAFAKAQAMNHITAAIDIGKQPKSGELLSDEQMNALLDDGFLQYDPGTNAVHIRTEDAKQISAEKKADWMIKSIRHVFGPDVTIKVVPTKDMQLASQDRQM